MSESTTITTLLTHVNRTLPDSITERRKLLASMLDLMAEGHPAWADVSAELKAIDRAIEFQARAQLRFQNLTK